MQKYTITIVFILFASICFGQTTTKKNTVKKTPVKKTVVKKPIELKTEKIPLQAFVDIINNIESFVVNQQTAFKHLDVPKSKYNMFLSYIKDSSVAEMNGLKSLVYYNFTLKNGKIINADIYLNNTNSYIIFKIDDKRYVNYFTLDGTIQLINVFKL